MAEEKQYQSLYRKYRPQGPQEVLGQEHVVRALTGAADADRLAHAYLFCGPRGTGKTSTARILAKMVNCETGGEHPTATPCGTCEQCVSIRDGWHMDVYELDAASHGGVEDARELRERAPTAPAFGREKVYIIDEAQRLSGAAFDALLKLLEEPPPKVRFVLATTEPHKMPATIVGRCQRFDFRRVGVDELSGHLISVAEQENTKLSRSAAELIARHSEGSVRDALSVLDQASLLGGGDITDDVLVALLGEPPIETQYALADALAVGDTRSVFEVVNSLVQEGQDLRHVTAESLTHFRNLLIIHASPGDASLIDSTPDEYARLTSQSAKFTATELSRIIGLLLDAQSDMRWTTSPRITLELALVRAGLPEADPAPEGLISRIERLERRIGLDAPRSEIADEAPPAPAAMAPVVEEVAPAPPGPAPAPTPAPKSAKAAPAPAPAEPAGVPLQPPVSVAGELDLDSFRRAWRDVIAHLRTSRQMILATNLEVATPVSFDGQVLELAFPPDRTFGVSKVEAKEEELREVLDQMFGAKPRVRCVIRDAVGEMFLEEQDEEPPTEADALKILASELGAEVTAEEQG